MVRVRLVSATLATMAEFCCTSTVQSKNSTYSLVPISVTGQLADTPTRELPTRGLDNSRTGQVADWTNSRMPPATACLVFVLLAAFARARVVQSATCPVRELAIRELAYPRVVQLPLHQQALLFYTITALHHNSALTVA